jgi:hypothetical protein
LRDRRQPKSEVVFKILPLVCCVRTIITSSLFTGFECMSNDWKLEKVIYEFGIGSFLRLPDCSSLLSTGIPVVWPTSKSITHKPFTVLGRVNDN